MESQHWADQLADQILERSKTPNVKCQQTPSGAKHIGNLNDVIRAYFPCKALMERGIKVDFVHTTDDRDPLKDVPKKLADLESNWHLSEKLMDMKPYFGKPLFMVPDPFGCCQSWSVHFTTVWMNGVNELGMYPTLYSVNDLYKKGKFEPYIVKVFEKREEVGKIITKFQGTKSKDYIPFDAICPSCGMLSNIDSFNLETKKVHFICGGKAIKKKKSEGCGFDGEVLWSQGKLQWRFEWPALWAIFNTTFEPFGKDHAEGSWKSGQVIAKEIFEIEPPIPYVYEFFLVNGEKMSASVGNVYIVQDLLKLIEPEVLSFFYTKRPSMQRDMDLKNIYTMVDDFEHAERVYYGAEKEENEHIKINLDRCYQLSCSQVKEKLPVRIQYQFAATVAQLSDNLETALEILKSTGHITKVTDEDKRTIENRLRLAKNWVNTYAPENKIELNRKPRKDFKLDENEKRTIDLFIKAIEESNNPEELYAKCFSICRETGIKTNRFFEIIYQLIINKERGPRLAPFIFAIGKERVLELLKI